jgi:hypothetical protein
MTTNSASGTQPDIIAATHELLASWRGQLGVLFELQRVLPAGQLPDEVPVNVARARREIADVKARLRGWGETVDDQPADAETADPQEIEHALRLRAIYRRNLAQLSAQRAQFPEREVPLHVTNGIAEASAQLERIESQLRAWGVPFEA